MYNASTDLNKFKVTWRELDWDGEVQGHHPSSSSLPRSTNVTSRSLSKSHLEIIL